MATPEISRLDLLFEVSSEDLEACCISLANQIDVAVGMNEVPGTAQELPLILNHICRRECKGQTKAMVMMLMTSVKSACQAGWFSHKDTQELLVLADEMLSGVISPENIVPSLDSPGNLFLQILERFYPFVKLGHILVSLEANPGSLSVLTKDFQILKKTAEQKIGLFVVRTDDINTSNCIIHPQEVSFLLNGRAVENRVIISMDSGPQGPTNVSEFLLPGGNLLQAVGHFGGNYIIVIAFMDVMSLSNTPLLKDYVHSEVIKSNSGVDCEITEGPSRISLSCPIRGTRVKLPVKGQVCKHLQCFDFWNYVNINIKKPSWRCPHCNQSVCYTDIRVDQIMIKILKEVGSDATDVVISADGSWEVVAEKDKNVELVLETTDACVDPNSFLNLGPTVSDLIDKFEVLRPPIVYTYKRKKKSQKS